MGCRGGVLMLAQPTRRLRAVNVWCVWCVREGGYGVCVCVVCEGGGIWDVGGGVLMSAQPTRRLRAVSVWCVWCVCVCGVCGVCVCVVCEGGGIWDVGGGSSLIGYKFYVFFLIHSPLLPLSSHAVELGAQDHASECRCMVAARPSGQQTSVSLGTYTIQWRRCVNFMCDTV